MKFYNREKEISRLREIELASKNNAPQSQEQNLHSTSSLPAKQRISFVKIFSRRLPQNSAFRLWVRLVVLENCSSI